MDTEKYSLGEPARSIYTRMKGKRTNVTAIARRLAEITIPSAFPPEEWQLGDELPVNNQSIGAGLVNSLTSKITLGALPPGLPMASYSPQETAMKEQIDADPALWGEIKYSLSRRDESHRERMELTPARSVFGKAVRQHLIAGNCLGRWRDIDEPKVFTMNHYVVKRSAVGVALYIILELPLRMVELSEEMQDAVKASRMASSKKPQGAQKKDTKSAYDDVVMVYEVQKLIFENGKPKWAFWQELEDIHVEGSEETADYDTPPLYASWLIPDEEGDWGIPYCMDYEGDLEQVETYAASLQDMAVDASFSLTLIDPTGQTDIRQYRKAENLATIPGREVDVTRSKAQKGGDYQVVAAELDKASRRLAGAFMSASAFQRSGERVTAEEWRALLRELDEAMGGLYSDFAVGFPRWFILRFIHLHEEEQGDKMAPLPKDIIKVGIKTGLDNIGQSSEYDKLMTVAKDVAGIAGPEAFASEVNVAELTKRLLTAKAIKIEGLVKSADQKAGEMQQAQQQDMQKTLLEKGTGPLAKEGAGMIGQLLTQQQENAPQ